MNLLVCREGVREGVIADLMPAVRMDRCGRIGMSAMMGGGILEIDLRGFTT